MKYKIGDRLRIRMFEKNNYPAHWIGLMKNYSGYIVTIKEVHKNNYSLEEYLYFWEDEDFESINIMDKFGSKEFEI